jgi:hypothetical protein
MTEYQGPERRSQGVDLAAMIARIDERTANMVKTMDTLATKERVDAVEAKAVAAQTAVDEHVKNHQSMNVNRNLIIGSYMTAGTGFLAALIAYFKK